MPSFYYHLPHLLQNEESLQPAVQIGSGRKGGTFILFLTVVVLLVLIVSWSIILTIGSWQSENKNSLSLHVNLGLILKSTLKGVGHFSP